MDPDRFDRLARSLSRAKTRRHLVHLLGALPLGMTLASLSGETPDATADDDHGSSHRRHRRKAKHRHDPGQHQDHPTHTPKRKRKSTRKDTPRCTPTTCAAEGKNCGTIADGCGGQLRCGPDACGDGFSCTENVCRCGDGTAVCEGICCQDPGQVCQNGDGACCTAEGQAAACDGRACGPATDSCTGAVYACGAAGDDCATRGFTCTGAGQCECPAPRASCPTSGSSPTCCQSGDVCTDGTGVCWSPTTCTAQGTTCGSIPDGCGGTLSCGSCANPTPICGASGCTACSAHAECPSNHLCHEGRCQVCDVTCPSGDSPATCGAALQAALAPANPGGHTVYVCAGTYRGGFTLPASLTDGVTVIGAGEGSDPASNTVLDANGAGGVLTINTGVGTVTLEQLHLTNGLTNDGGGISHDGSTLRMTACTVTRNTATNGEGGAGGGMHIGPFSTLEMTRCTVSDNHAPDDFGTGGGILCYGPMTLTDCVIEANTASFWGGGLVVGTDPAILSTLLGSTTVRGNTAATGGGMYVPYATLEIAETCRVTHNTASAGLGGGIFNNAGTVTLLGPDDPSPIVVDNCQENCSGFIPRCDPGGPVRGRTCPP